ncbi:Uncharacterised protein [Brucella anthropi]|nr:Uncharacterised protein [Brucella anthropi]
MKAASARYKHHRFPSEIIAHAVWLYYRFLLSLRMIEEMLLDEAFQFPTKRSGAGAGGLMRVTCAASSHLSSTGRIRY